MVEAKPVGNYKKLRKAVRYSATIPFDIITEKKIKKWIPICPPRHPSNYEKMTEHYLDCIVNDKEPLVSGQDGADSIDVMCGVFKSMETNSWVDLPLKEEVIPPNYKKLELEN